MSFKWRFLAIVTSWVLVSVTQAKEIIVAGLNPMAGDSNAGTSDKPLKTISAAAARVRAGDLVIIHGGDYRETVIVTVSGTEKEPIVFEAAPNETPVIKGSEVIKNWVRESSHVWKAKLPAVPSNGRKSNEPSFWGTNDVRQVFSKDALFLDAKRLRSAKAANELHEGTYLCNRETNELSICLEDTSDPNQLIIEASVRGAWLYVFGSNIVVRGLQMRHSSTLAIVNWPACSLIGNNITLENCQLSWGDYIGVGGEGKNFKLLGCTISCNGNSGIAGNGEGHVIERCRVTYNNTERYDPAWHAGGAKLIPSFNHGRIAHCEFAFNLGPGLWLDDGCNDNVIEGNFCHDNEGPGIMVEISSGNLLSNNICYANRNPLSGDFLRPDPEAVQRGIHNVFQTVHRNAEGGQPVYHAGEGRGIYISSSPGSKVYHNTCYLNEGEGICVEGELREASKGIRMSTRDCSLLNNISAYNKGAQLVLRRNDKDENTHDNASDYNLLIALGAVLAQAGWDEPFAVSLNQWQQRTQRDPHSIQVDPAFVMAAMSDFHLLPSSPAVGAGARLAEVGRDFSGQERGRGQVSLGACEQTKFDYPQPAGLQLNLPPSH